MVNFRVFDLRLLLILSCLLLAASPLTASAGQGISAFLGSEDNDILPPDEAFKLTVIAQDAQTLSADFKIVPGHYLYRDRIKFEIKPATNSIISAELPKGEIKKDPNFGETEVFHHNFSAAIKLAAMSPRPAQITLLATYQGCSEKGLCYAPIHKTFTLDLPAPGNNTSANTANPDDDEATSLLKGGKLWLIAAGFFGFGLLLALTPCVLPMIPILSGIIVGDKKVHHHATSRLHSFNLSLAYTFGMALTYTLAGIAAGLSGQLLSNALQSSWVLGATALIFVLLSFSMFGFYELRLPGSIEHSMVNATNRLKGGQFLGVFGMGALSALIVSPCVAAPLAGALLYISQTHDVLLGGVALFALSIGMGVPLLLIGASAGHVLPKAGLWMTAVRNAFGVLMLGVAIWIIAPAIPMSVQMALWAALLIIPAIYMHALDSLPVKASAWMKFWKGIAIIMLVFGVSLLIGAVSGAKSPLQPLAGLRAASTQEHQTALPFKRIKNLGELESQIKASSGKVVMLDYYADWCVSCKEMDQFTFSDPAVKNALKDVVLLQADVTANTPEDLALLNRFKLFGPPGIIFFNRAGQEIKPMRVIGYQEAAQFLSIVNRVNALKEDECNPLVAC